MVVANETRQTRGFYRSQSYLCVPLNPYPSYIGRSAGSIRLAIAISGFNPDIEGGVLKLADDCQDQGRNVLPIRLRMLGRNVITQGLDAIRDFFKVKEQEQEARKRLQHARRAIKDAAAANRDRKIHIICHSWGCTLALRVAQDLGDVNK
ncbi:MAG: alpha/beta hydrolase [Candidatus Saccharimonadales bacterium]